MGISLVSFTGNTRGSITEATGGLYTQPLYGCIQSVTVTTESISSQVSETAVDFSEDVIGGSGVVGPQACSSATTETPIRDA